MISLSDHQLRLVIAAAGPLSVEQLQPTLLHVKYSTLARDMLKDGEHAVGPAGGNAAFCLLDSYLEDHRQE
jgi:hypothetical protein